MYGKFFLKNTRYTSAYKLICSREYGCVLGCRHVLVISVSSSGVGTVFALLFVRLDKLFQRQYFFGAQFFLYTLFHPFLVYGLLVVKFT